MEAEEVGKGKRRTGKGMLLGDVHGETYHHGALTFTILPFCNKIVRLESSLWSDCSYHLLATVKASSPVNCTVIELAITFSDLSDYSEHRI